MKKKHSFGFLYKYLFLAAALMAVLCFCCVFARFTTGATEKVTANIDGFVLSSYVYEDMGKNENGDEVYYEKEHASGVVVGSDKDEYLMVLVVVNECDFPVSCEIKMGEGYMITEAVTYTGCFEPSEDGKGYKVSPDSIDVTTIYSSSTDIPGGAVSVTGTDETGAESVVGLKSTPIGNVAAYNGEDYFPFLTLVFTVGKNITEYDGDAVQTILGLENDTYHGYWHSFDFTVYYAQTGEVD